MADSGICVAIELSVQATGKLIAEAMLEGQPTACPSLAIQDERLTDPSEPAHHPLGSRQDRPVEEGVNPGADHLERTGPSWGTAASHYFYFR
jgi:hypothetical protein